MNDDNTEMTPGADICPHCKDGILHWTEPYEPWSGGHWICGTCYSTYHTFPKLKKETQVGECPHCGSTKDTWFSRTEPMGFVCPDCGRDVDEEPTTNELLKPTKLVVSEPATEETTKSCELAGLVRELFSMLDQEETSAGGRDFHPTTIQSCRIQHTMRLNEILPQMKELAHKAGVCATTDTPKT
jgi:DNA-directed RNA polymerase subunit RPC12/RpoP